jgi:hypothetical protein
MKNKNRIQILLRILSKSDQIMDDIANLTMQVYPSEPRLFMRLDESSLFASHNSAIDKKDYEGYRNALIQQFKESTAKNL